MTALDTAPTTRATRSPATLWRWAGALVLAHVVLLFAGFSHEVVADHSTSPSKLQHTYGDANINRVFTGGYVEAMSFVVLVAAVVLVSYLYSRRTTVGRLASQTFRSLGIVYAATTLAVGFAPGAAAIYAAHHGVDIGAIAMVNDIRNYSYVLQVAICLAMTLALGVAALAEGINRRWVGVGGVVIGGIGVLAVPFAHNAIGMVQMIWWVGLGVLCLRARPESE